MRPFAISTRHLLSLVETRLRAACCERGSTSPAVTTVLRGPTCVACSSLNQDTERRRHCCRRSLTASSHLAPLDLRLRCDERASTPSTFHKADAHRPSRKAPPGTRRRSDLVVILSRAR